MFNISHSTQSATLKVASDVHDAMDAGKVTILALLDVSAAFDTVDHATSYVQPHVVTWSLPGPARAWVGLGLFVQSRAVFKRQGLSSSLANTR